MAYPSVITQAGASERNKGPVIEALSPLIQSDTKRVLELASFPYEHIRGYAEQWPQVHFTGTARDEEEVSKIATNDLPPNVAPPVKLDIAEPAHWAALTARAEDEEPFDGVVMLNLIHCTPEGLPEEIFRHLSPMTDDGKMLLSPRGFIAAYGAYLNDDGSFRSDGDEKFDREFIKGIHPSLGLRTPASITAMATKWGFEEVQRKEMPKGNLWLVWRAIG